jgi:hypothetical protein
MLTVRIMTLMLCDELLAPIVTRAAVGSNAQRTREIWDFALCRCASWREGHAHEVEIVDYH